MTEFNESIIQVGKKKYHIGGTTVETDKPFKERSAADFYPTEQALIDAWIARTNLCQNYPMGVVVGDLGAGDGRWGTAVKNKYPEFQILGTDIRDLPKPPNFRYWFPNSDIYNIKKEVVPFTHWDIHSESLDVIVGNPPYNIAMDWVELCLDIIDKWRGEIHLLLPLSWLAGTGRYEKFYSKNLKPDVMVCSTRPSFSENGKTYPSREYGIFSWIFKADVCVTTGRLSWLAYERKKK